MERNHVLKESFSCMSRSSSLIYRVAVLCKYNKNNKKHGKVRTKGNSDIKSLNSKGIPLLLFLDWHEIIIHSVRGQDVQLNINKKFLLMLSLLPPFPSPRCSKGAFILTISWLENLQSLKPGWMFSLKWVTNTEKTVTGQSLSEILRWLSEQPVQVKEAHTSM